jgi:hypothetical protein
MDSSLGIRSILGRAAFLAAWGIILTFAAHGCLGGGSLLGGAEDESAPATVSFTNGHTHSASIRTEESGDSRSTLLELSGSGHTHVIPLSVQEAGALGGQSSIVLRRTGGADHAHTVRLN